jgi:thymidine phosphorylase
VGLVLRAKVGAEVAAGTPLLTIHAATRADAERVAPGLAAAYTVGDEPVQPPPLIEEIVS